jgi:hypothetical protein
MSRAFMVEAHEFELSDFHNDGFPTTHDPAALTRESRRNGRMLNKHVHLRPLFR